ncbi:hypothetical protein ASF82_08860 [Frigoribacterium sp. Leaf164]|uniref:hypothetical protein n=1 Tax=Frigoribacterium sp. Leaf164 TaxID=1736282 RepID=UPI0006F21F3E|nr:hypothetical protein [Frigoribacterium sp. Leaf164]KQR43736.1 hypothetical protein ASF82_08860 [Frigoribacterium sp. Leaf164]
MTSTQPGQPTPGSTVRAAVVSLRGTSGRDRLVAAATAVGVVLLARFALGLLAMVGAAVGFSVTAFPSGFAATPVGQFLGSFVFYPFPFYVVAFVVLLVVRPLETAAPLATVLRRALVAGAAGTLALAVVGVVPGVLLSQSGGTWANLVLYVTTIPLAAGVVDTALLVVGAVLAWLWARREGDDPAGADPEADARPEAVVVPPTPTSSDAEAEADADADATGAPARVSGPSRAPRSGPADHASFRPAAVAPVDADDAPARPAVEPEATRAPDAPRRSRRAADPARDDWSRFAPPADRGEGER